MEFYNHHASKVGTTLLGCEHLAQSATTLLQPFTTLQGYGKVATT